MFGFVLSVVCFFRVGKKWKYKTVVIVIVVVVGRQHEGSGVIGISEGIRKHT